MAGRYRKYLEYRNSGVEWIGLAPSHWSVKKLKWELSAKSGIDNKNENGIYDLYGANGVIGKSDTATITHINGTVIIGRVGSAGLVNFVKTKAGVSDNALVIENGQINIPRFDYYLIKSLNLEEMVSKNAQPLITASNIRDSKVAIPSDVMERQQIANFLDHETAKVDALIERQQQLIILLKEKRQAVISHAVTKGLNPGAPMKDSGIEWLGEVPEHWGVSKAKYLFDFITSGSRGWAGYYADEGKLFFRIANLTRDTVNTKLDSVQKVLPPSGSEGERAVIKFGDILISITADLGSVCVADKEVVGGYVSQHIALCRPNSRVRAARWMAYSFLSDSAKKQLLGAGYGGTKIQLSLEDIKDLWIAIPPAMEQFDLADYIDNQMKRFTNLMNMAEWQIQLLQERRTALISAAVTGKIDVRHWQPPPDNPPPVEETS